MNSSQKGLIKGFFNKTRMNYVIGGFEHKHNEERFLISSAALMRKDTLLSGSLKFINRMPKRSTVSKYLLKKRAHIISLFQPEDLAKINIHGEHPKGLLCIIHDGYHADKRTRCRLLEEKELLETSLLITEVLKTLPKYTSDKAVSEERFYRRLTSAAIEADKARFFLEEIVQHIIDGENLAYAYHKDEIPTTGMHLSSIISPITNNDYSLGPFIKGRLSQEFNKFGYNIIPDGYSYEVIKN